MIQKEDAMEQYVSPSSRIMTTITRKVLCGSLPGLEEEELEWDNI